MAKKRTKSKTSKDRGIISGIGQIISMTYAGKLLLGLLIFLLVILISLLISKNDYEKFYTSAGIIILILVLFSGLLYWVRKKD